MRKNNRDPVVDHVPEVRARKTNRESEKQVEDFRKGKVIIYFDGACRRGTVLRCASAVFEGKYESKFSKGVEVEAGDSLEAEIRGAIMAVQTASNILREEREKKDDLERRKKQKGEHKIDPDRSFQIEGFEIRGDSMIIHNAVKSGDLLRYDGKHSLSKQSAAWAKLKTEYDQLQQLGFPIHWEWVPRNLNREADELCNAALDGRAPNPEVKSATSADPVNVQQLMRIVDALSRIRRKTPRRLPDQLAKIWASFVFDVVCNYDKDPLRTRLLFMCLPHLINVGLFPFVGGRADFTQYRAHLHSLSNEVYLNDQIRLLEDNLRKKPDTTIVRPNDTMTEKHLMSLCARGEYQKCYLEADTAIAEFTDETASTIAKGIPREALPTPIQCFPEDRHEVSFAEVKEAFRKLKKGKACGHSGWNRELLFPVLLNPPPLVRASITKIFNDYANALVSEPEEAMFRSLVIIPMTYKSKPGKIRSIMITDGLVKMTWQILFLNIKDAKLERSGQVFTQKGQTTLAVCAIQSALEMGRKVVSLDAVNAFPTLKRESFMIPIAKTSGYAKVRAFTNLMYSKKAKARFFSPDGGTAYEYEVTTGCLQGCVSGPRLYSIGTVDIALKYHGSVVMVADDTYIIGKDAIEMASAIIQDFATIGQKLDGPKMKVISPVPNLPTLPEALNNATIKYEPTEVLGGYVNPTGKDGHILFQQSPELVTKIVDIKRKCNKILILPMSSQCKFLVLRSLAKSFIYRAQTYFHPASREYFRKIDQTFQEALAKFIKMDASHNVRVFSPIEDGGLGFYPYADFHPFLQNQAVELASGFLHRLGLVLAAPPNTTNSLMMEWRNTTNLPIGGARERDGRSFIRSEFHSWLECRPSSRWTRIDDNAFATQMGIILQNLKPFAAECEKDNQPFNPGTLPEAEFTHHMTTCAFCTKKGFLHRHEAVNNAIRATLRFHGIHSYIPRQTDLPLPDATKGGPDLIVFAESTDAVDVSITTTQSPKPGQSIRANMTEKFNLKLRKYQKFESLTSYRIVPFIVSIYGLVAFETRVLLESWRKSATETTFLFDLYNNVQMSLIKAQHEMIRFVENRSKTTNAQRQWQVTVNG